jgi:hypothetical protein
MYAVSVDPRSTLCVSRVDEALARTSEIVGELEHHEPEVVGPVSVMLETIMRVKDPGERLFRTLRASPALPTRSESPAVELVAETFQTLTAIAKANIDCFAVTYYVLAKQTDPVQDDGGFPWRKVRAGGIVLRDELFLNAPIHACIKGHGTTGIFGVQLTGGPLLPIVVDATKGEHSLEDGRFWGSAAFEALIGDPPHGICIRTGPDSTEDIDFGTIDWCRLDRLWKPPVLPEGARTAPASVR